MWSLTVCSHVQDQILGKQISSTQEGLWSVNNQNYLLPDLLQQSQISDSSVNPPKVPLTSQEPQNKPLNKTPCTESTPSKSSTSSTTSFTSFIDPRLLPITPPTSPVGPSCSSREYALPFSENVTPGFFFFGGGVGRAYCLEMETVSNISRN